jgi:hypothetical protein
MAPAPNWDGGPRATLKWGRPRHLGARRASGGSMPPERAPRSGRTVGAWLHRPSLRPRAPARETLTRRAMGCGRSSARVIRAGCFRTLSAGPMSIVGTCAADLPLRSMQIFDLRPATAQASWRRAKLGRAGMIGMSGDPCRRILDRHRVGVLEHHSMAVSTLHRPRSRPGPPGADQGGGAGLGDCFAKRAGHAVSGTHPLHGRMDVAPLHAMIGPRARNSDAHNRRIAIVGWRRGWRAPSGR